MTLPRRSLFRRSRRGQLPSLKATTTPHKTASGNAVFVIADKVGVALFPARGGVQVLPGVTIGADSVIGAGVWTC